MKAKGGGALGWALEQCWERTRTEQGHGPKGSHGHHGLQVPGRRGKGTLDCCANGDQMDPSQACV